MKTIAITPNRAAITSRHIFSPILVGLNAEQADCAAVIPSGNANKILMNQLAEAANLGLADVAVFCNDPFINNHTFFSDLFELGVRTVTNWPSSIFFEQSFKKAMGHVLVSPSNEFEYLANAMNAGLDARAIVLSLNHAKEALSLGIKSLIIHPGLKLELSDGAKTTLFESIHLMIETLLEIEPSLEIFIYQHSEADAQAHQRKYKNNVPKISGYVVYEAST